MLKLVAMTLRARNPRTRALIALIAAYAVALQMLFSVAVAGQHAGLAIAPDVAAAICLTSGTSAPDDPAKSPVRQAPCVLCAMANAGVAPDVAEVAFRFGNFENAFTASFTPVATATPHFTPRLSQGPPQIA